MVLHPLMQNALSFFKIQKQAEITREYKYGRFGANSTSTLKICTESVKILVATK